MRIRTFRQERGIRSLFALMGCPNRQPFQGYYSLLVDLALELYAGDLPIDTPNQNGEISKDLAPN